jgi:hypothetical protein
VWEGGDGYKGKLGRSSVERLWLERAMTILDPFNSPRHNLQELASTELNQ